MAEKQKLTPRVIIARVVVGVLFSMLIVSFAIWGIGPIFRENGHYRPVAEVGSVHITPQQFQEQYRREVNRIQSALQTPIDPERARSLNIPERVIQQMVGRSLFDLAAHDAGVAVSDAVVRASIVDNPNFRNAKGEFDRNLFENLLYNAGYSEDQFVTLARFDLARAQVTDAITAGIAVPGELSDLLFRYQFERRSAQILTVSASSIADIPTPTDAELDAFLKDHADAYTAPEYRAVTAVLLQPAEIANGFPIPDQKVRDEYDARIAEFRTPEERTLRQIVLPNEAAAKHAEELIASGKTFNQVATQVTGKPPIDLGTIKPGDIANDELSKAAFGLKEGAASAPIQDPLGWHIFQVTKIVPGSTESFDAVAPKLRHELQLRAAGDAIFDLGNKLQDTLGGGATLEEAAQKLNLKLIKVAAIDAKGLGADGKPVDGVPQTAKFVSTAFAADTGRESDLIDDGHGGFFILRVDKVSPSHVKTLAEVRNQVLADWRTDARSKAAEKVAADLLARAKGGASLESLARSGGNYKIATTSPFLRTGQGADQVMPPALVAAMFAAHPGDVAMAPMPDGAVIGKLLKVEPADPKTDATLADQLRDRLAGTLGADLLNSFADALRRQYGVEINSDMLNSLVGS
jgi:peptidyl-prolyl cis-trans isomerase D